MDVALADVQSNIAKVIEHIRACADNGANLVVFPECALTGYGYAVLEHCQGFATKPEQYAEIQKTVDETNTYCVVGTMESGGDVVKNVARFFSPQAPNQLYVKTHLPFMGADRFTTPGDALPLFETPWGSIGILICYDLRFPEATRTMVLNGADLILVPTNWPVGADVSADHIAIARAAENRVFVATCNRVGDESGFTFFGRSKIIGIDGAVLSAATDAEQVIYAEIDLVHARKKRRIVIPGEYETDLIEDRRPDLYSHE